MNWTNRPIALGIVIFLIAILIVSIQLSNQKLAGPGDNPTLVSQIITANQPDNNNQVNFQDYPIAPEIKGIYKWLNSQPLSLSNLRGKVVLVDFWTYSCINCIRTLPHMNAWHEQYANQGLVIIGVHSPEFYFEKFEENVQNAINQHELKYPVAMDNDFKTWKAYSNKYWPAKYLIDANGFVRYVHFGEGSYDQTENEIRKLLREANLLNENQTILNPAYNQMVDFAQIGTPELYFGQSFKRVLFGNDQPTQINEVKSYVLPANFNSNLIYLQGDWNAQEDYQQLSSETGEIRLSFKAKVVNLVMGSKEPVLVDVLINGKKVQTITVQQQQLYQLAQLEDYNWYDVQLKIQSSGLEVYAFTFG